MKPTDMSHAIDQEIDALLERGAWTAARRLLLKELKKSPSHWVLTHLSTAYVGEDKYDLALHASERATRIAPWCPLALWDYACALDFVGHKQAAIAAWQKLIKWGVKRIAYGDCGEGLPMARSFVNDARYRIGYCLGELEDYPLAVRYIRAHLKCRGPRYPSSYKRALVEKHLKEFINKKSGGVPNEKRREKRRKSGKTGQEFGGQEFGNSGGNSGDRDSGGIPGIPGTGYRNES